MQPTPPEAAIIITGEALPTAASERVYHVERIGAGAIASAPSREIDQLIKGIAGVQLFRRSDARSGHPTGQGVTLRALGGNAASRVLVMLDGVPQSDPFGGWLNWPAYDPLSLEEVRVVRGGGSVTHGPGALAGTISLSSRSTAGASAEVDAGSRGALEAGGRAGWQAVGGLVSLALRGARGDGFVPVTAATRGAVDRPAPYRRWLARGRYVAPLGGSTEIQANLSAFHDWRTRGTEFGENRTNGVDGSLRLVGRGRWQWSALAYAQWRNLMSSFASVGAGRQSVARASLQDSVPSHGQGASIELRPPQARGYELRLGADFRRTEGESRELFSYVAGLPTRRRRAGGQSWAGGIFSEASAELDGVMITGGARIDHWRISHGHLFEKVIASGQVVRDEREPVRSGWLPTARAGIRVPTGPIEVRSAAYLGWRMPTLNELFRPFRAGSDATAANPRLDPERLAGMEAGGDFNRGPLRVSITGFTNRLRDAVANVTLGQGPGNFPGVGFVGAGGAYRQRQNIDAVRARGVEASAGWAKGPWTVRASASLTRARVDASGAAAALDGLRPAQTPGFAASLSAGWQRGARGAEIALRRVGGQYEDDLNTRLLKAATTVDGSVSWPVTRQLRVVARAENLTNALVMAGIGNDGSVERATPRTLWIGLALR
ncbi:MAG TPA: TonB-dependent receptor [Sphingomicrobium sp.]|nr:TonB-dependent receptor [Sphingomicrobium sp.]